MRAVAAARIRIPVHRPRAPHCPQRRWEPRDGRGARQADARAPKRTGSSAGRPVSAATSAIAVARLVVARRSPPVFSAMHATLALRAGSAIRSCSSTSSAKRRDRVSGAALDLGRAGASGRARTRAAPSRGRARASRPSTAGGRASPGPRRRAARRRAGALDDEPLRRAREEVGDDRVDGDPPARDRDPGLAGRARRRTRGRGGAPRGRARPRPSSCRSRSPSRR